MHYRFDTTTNIQDRFEMRLYELNHTPYGKRSEKRYRLTVLLLLPFVWMIGYAIYPYIWDFLTFAMIMLIGEGVWQLLIKTIMRRQLLRQLHREEKVFGLGSSEIFFYDDGFCDVTDEVKYDVQYRNVCNAVLYKNSYFFLRTKRLFFIVPCRALTGQATTAEFADFLQSRGIALETVQ